VIHTITINLFVIHTITINLFVIHTITINLFVIHTITINLFVIHTITINLFVIHTFDFCLQLEHIIRRHTVLKTWTECYSYFVCTRYKGWISVSLLVMACYGNVCFCTNINNQSIVAKRWDHFWMTSLQIKIKWNDNDDVHYKVSFHKWFGWFMAFTSTFNNISVTSRRSVLLVEETGVPGGHHRPVASH
jgi:hypothetical protein